MSQSTIIVVEIGLEVGKSRTYYGEAGRQTTVNYTLAQSHHITSRLLKKEHCM